MGKFDVALTKNQLIVAFVAADNALRGARQHRAETDANIAVLNALKPLCGDGVLKDAHADAHAELTKQVEWEMKGLTAATALLMKIEDALEVAGIDVEKLRDPDAALEFYDD